MTSETLRIVRETAAVLAMATGPVHVRKLVAALGAISPAHAAAAESWLSMCGIDVGDGRVVLPDGWSPA
jgi:hypothetical protein